MLPWRCARVDPSPTTWPSWSSIPIVRGAAGCSICRCRRDRDRTGAARLTCRLFAPFVGRTPQEPRTARCRGRPARRSDPARDRRSSGLGRRPAVSGTLCGFSDLFRTTISQRCTRRLGVRLPEFEEGFGLPVWRRCRMGRRSSPARARPPAPGGGRARPVPCRLDRRWFEIGADHPRWSALANERAAQYSWERSVSATPAVYRKVAR